MPDFVEMATAFLASLGIVLAVCAGIGLGAALVGIVLDALDFGPEDVWEGEEE